MTVTLQEQEFESEMAKPVIGDFQVLKENKGMQDLQFRDGLFDCENDTSSHFLCAHNAAFLGCSQCFTAHKDGMMD